jgi:hypothetical protein
VLIVTGFASRIPPVAALYQASVLATPPGAEKLLMVVVEEPPVFVRLRLRKVINEPTGTGITAVPDWFLAPLFENPGRFVGVVPFKM